MAGFLQRIRDWVRILRATAPLRIASDPARPVPYRPFTTEFDREVSADDIELVASPDPRPSADRFREARSAFDAARGALAEGNPAWSAAFATAKSVIGQRSDQIAVSILIDQSGSLGIESRSVWSALSAYSAALFFLGLGCVVEVLGFTTRSWHGGRSRDKWNIAGRPSYPGRLCDLLHIIYRAAEDVSREPPETITKIMDPRWLKENVDGGALLWAASRLRKLPQDVKILLVISDGAPVDDTTLITNGPSILYAHLKETIRVLSAGGDIELGAVGILYDIAEDLYPKWVRVAGSDDVAAKLPGFMTSLLDQRLAGAFQPPNPL